jgi:hypothetical protein
VPLTSDVVGHASPSWGTVTPIDKTATMGKSNRQRRAAKQHERARQTRQQRDPSTSAPRDDRVAIAELVYAAVAALRAGDRTPAALISALEDGPPALVRSVLEDSIRQQRALLSQHGWTPSDCDELVRRRLKVDIDAGTVERSVRTLALLCGLPPLPEVAPPPRPKAGDGKLAKIRALLAKAESTTFPEEAEALTAKAQELIVRHRIDRVLLDAGTNADGPVGRRIWLDNPYADAKAQLLHVIATANRCRSVNLDGIGCCHVIGFAGDLDVVDLLHTSLLVQATTAMAAAGSQRDARGRSRTRSFRQSFLVAYAHRIGQRLAEAVAHSEAEAVEEARVGGIELLPVLARRDRAVDEVVNIAFPTLVSRSTRVTNAAGWHAGSTAADLADLSVGGKLTKRSA